MKSMIFLLVAITTGLSFAEDENAAHKGEKKGVITWKDGKRVHGRLTRDFHFNGVLYGNGNEGLAKIFNEVRDGDYEVLIVDQASSHDGAGDSLRFIEGFHGLVSYMGIEMRIIPDKELLEYRALVAEKLQNPFVRDGEKRPSGNMQPKHGEE